MTRHVALIVVIVACVAGPRLFAAPTPLQSALDLYAAAAYDEALAAFDAVSVDALSLDERALVAQHRMLCLMAMGRTADAERAAASLLGVRPEFVLGVRDAAPRVRTMFDSARRRVLPGVLRERYASARRLYETGALAEARSAFDSITRALGDPGIVESDPTLADLRILADGFLALATAAVRPVAAPAADPALPLPSGRLAVAVTVPAVESPVPAGLPDTTGPLVAFPTDSSVAWREGHTTDRVAEAPTVERLHGAVSAAPDSRPIAAATGAADVGAAVAPSTDAPPAVASPPAAAHAAAGAPFAPIDIFTYDWRDKDVTPPVAVSQAVSGWWGRMGEPASGTPLGAVELVIDEGGRVADAKIYSSVNRVYDAVLMASVGQWRYQPATRGGRPVKYRRISGVVSGR